MLRPRATRGNWARQNAPAMQAKWGTIYSFLENGCDVGSRTRLRLSDAGRPLTYVTRVDVSGWLEGDGQAALALEEEALREALLKNYRDFKFLTDAGATTPTSILNSESLSGVRVVDGPNFTGTDGAEYATLRKFDFAIEAEYLVPGAENAVVSFTEQVTIVGTGGPSKRLRVPINATFLVRQQLSLRSVVRATQSGTAVGLTRRPAPPPPLWRKHWLEDQSQVSQTSPKLLGRAYTDYGVSWNYQFEADEPLVAVPNLFPI